MLRTLWWAMLAVAAAGTAHGAANGAERVQRFLDDTKSLSAHFEQTLIDPDGEIAEVSEGTLALERPGRFRWDYAPPHEQVIVADGSRIWLYDPLLEQVTVKALDETLGNTPAMLLSGGGRLADAYEHVRDYDADGLSWVELEPRSEASDFRLVRLAFEGDTLRRMELADALDQVTRIDFTEVERNPTLADSLFTFVPPPGTDVVGDATPPGDTQ